MIYPRVSTKPLPNDAKGPLPVDVRHSKTLLLKLPIVYDISPTLTNYHCCIHTTLLSKQGPPSKIHPLGLKIFPQTLYLFP